MKVKVLMYGKMFVNTSMLQDGIYSTDFPELYKDDETIEDLINSYRMLRIADEMGFIEKIIENLRKCKLVDYELQKLRISR